MRLFGSITELVRAVIRTAAGKEVRIESAAQTGTSPIVTTIPDVGDAADTFVMADTAQTLTNKSINADANTITNIENADIKAGAAIDATKIADGSVTSTEFQFINTLTSNAQTQIDTKVTGPASATNEAIVRFDGTTGKLVKNGTGTISTAGVMAGVSIDADTNTITNIENADIKAGAAIDATKIANGTVSNTEFQRLDSAGTAGAGNLVTTDGTQTLTNKTLTAPLQSSYEDFSEIAAPGTPASNVVRLYAKADGKFYKKDDTGVEQAVGSGGGSGGVNYLVNTGNEWDFESGLATGWVTYADAAGVAPVDGTGGAPTVTFAASATAPLRDLYSGLFTKDAANRQGQGVAVPFTLDNQDTGKSFFFSMDISASANYTGSSGAEYVSVYIYDVTNAVLLPGFYNVAPGSSTLKGSFLASTSTSYRFIFHVAGTGTAAYTVKVDDVVLGPQAQLNASVTSDWISFTPTWSGNAPTFSTNSGMYRRVGDSMEVAIRIIASGTGAGGTMFMSVPAGQSIDTNKIAGTAGAITSGGAGIIDGGGMWRESTNFRSISVGVNAATEIAFVDTTNANSGFIPGSDLTSGDILNARYVIPISNWSSNIKAADRAVEEFASNTSTTDADDTTSFANGAFGSLIPTITATDVAGARLKRVRFQTSIQPTDTIYIEVLDEGGIGSWKEVSSSRHYKKQFIQNDGTVNSYGINYQDVSGSTTDLDVRFGRAGLDSTGSGYASAGQSYPDTAGDRWRVRKVSGGALVGFPVGARNVIGDTSGTAVPAGYIGQLQTATSASVALTAGTYATPVNIALTPGNYILRAYIYLSGAASQTRIDIGISSDSTAAAFADEPSAASPGNANQALISTGGGGSNCAGQIHRHVSVTTNTTYYLKARIIGANGTAGVHFEARRVG